MTTDADLHEIEAETSRLTGEKNAISDNLDRSEDGAAELESESETESDDGEEQDGESILEFNRRANALEFSLGHLERDLETTTEEIESAPDEQEGLERRHTELREELAELRTRIDRLEREASSTSRSTPTPSSRPCSARRPRRSTTVAIGSRASARRPIRY